MHLHVHGPQDAALRRDRNGRLQRVARAHAHVDARGVALLNGARHRWPQRVLDAHDADERDAALGGVDRRVAAGEQRVPALGGHAVEVAVGQRERPHGRALKRLDAGVARGAVQGHARVAVDEDGVRRVVADVRRCALCHEAEAAAGPRDDPGHLLALGRKGVGLDAPLEAGLARGVLELGRGTHDLGVLAELRRQLEQRALSRVALVLPLTVRLERRLGRRRRI
mmetsp:Transcript_28185/g.94933  ORF Transcript_28185/g.94933 Transcript_28185/m.94933 type:complete len:225 (-) Transcript_28185:140-814(-)